MARVVWIVAMLVSLIAGPAVAQQMQPGGDMMMHGTKLDGTISGIRFVSCGDTPQSCQGIIQVTPASTGAMSGGAMMHEPGQMGGAMMMAHPLTIIVVPGTALMAHGSSVPLTRLRLGDHITCTYVTQGDMNIVTDVTVADTGHM